MFKMKPISVVVTHNVNTDELKGVIEDVKSDIKHYAKVAGITVVAGAAALILFAVAANVAGDVISDNLTNHNE